MRRYTEDPALKTSGNTPGSTSGYSARQMTYRVLAELYRSGPIPSIREMAEMIPEFRDVFPRFGAEEIRNGTLDERNAADEIAAAHHTMFGINVYPHASVFLEEDGFLGKGVTAAVRNHYEKSRNWSGEQRDEADHITTELFFCGRETNDTESQIDFLDTHLLAWLPVFVHAVERRNDAFYSRLVRFTLDFVVNHRTDLANLTSRADHLDPTGQDIAEAVFGTSGEIDAAREDAMSSALVATHFASARRCGLFLSRGDISDIARKYRLPTGFGGRSMMLRTLCESAETYEQGAGLRTALEDLCRKELQQWDSVIATGSPKALVYWSEVWKNRLQKSLETLRDAYGEESLTGPSP